MQKLWYYGRGDDISGPVTGRELADLANLGRIVLTDTIWLDANEDGVEAQTVKNLFPTTALTIVPEIAVVVPLEILPEVPDIALPEVVVAPVPAVPVEPVVPYPVPAVRKGRAVAGKGAVLVGQDGKTVKFRMKCPECKHEDSSWKTAAIPRGTHRASFFCPKCRKKRDAEILGYW
jgi:hypothetical protein